MPAFTIMANAPPIAPPSTSIRVACPVTIPISDRPVAYDFAINSAVEDTDALKRYLEHPAHTAGVALWREFATWVIADYPF